MVTLAYSGYYYWASKAAYSTNFILSVGPILLAIWIISICCYFWYCVTLIFESMGLKDSSKLGSKDSKLRPKDTKLKLASLRLDTSL